MRRALALAILLVPGLFLDAALAQEKKQDPKKKPAPEPKTWMCKKGELMFEENFEGGQLSKDWSSGKGDYKVEGDALKVAEVAADKHNAYKSRKVTDPNVIVQFSFKLDGCPWMGAAVDGSNHVSNLSLAADSFKIRKMEGIGPTTKGTDVDQRRMKLNDGAWHTVVWEIYADEMVATIDDKEMVLGKAEGISMERNHLELNSGGQFALYKEIKVWKAELDDKWPQKRAQLMQMLKKKPAAAAGK